MHKYIIKEFLFYGFRYRNSGFLTIGMPVSNNRADGVTSAGILNLQGKLVRVIKGEVFNVAVDIRKDSGTYGKWGGVILNKENKNQFYIREGFVHGFLVLSDEAEFCYKCTEFYNPEDEGGIAWDDMEIGIYWAIDGINKITFSEKDKKWKGIKEYIWD